MQDFLRDSAVGTQPWPAYSPDLSPIEHLWDLIYRRLRSRDLGPQTVLELRLAIQEEWDNIPQVIIARLISSMPRRCRAVHDAFGGHTRY